MKKTNKTWRTQTQPIKKLAEKLNRHFPKKRNADGE